MNIENDINFNQSSINELEDDLLSLKGSIIQKENKHNLHRNKPYNKKESSTKVKFSFSNTRTMTLDELDVMLGCK